jgi:O-acetylserine/cysteine efflux transporter
VWGVTYALLRVGIQHSPPLLFAALRMAGGGVLLLTVAVVLARPQPTGLRTHSLLLVGGVLNYALFYMGLNYGVRSISAGETAILNYTAPLWIALAAHFALAQPLGPRRIGGLLLGFLGVALVVGDKLRPGSDPVWSAYLFVSIGALSWGVGSVFFVRYLRGIALEWAVALQNLYGTLPLVVAWLLFEGGALPEPEAAFWFALGFSIVLASFVAQLAFFSLLRRRDAAIVGSYMYLTPVVAAASGWLLLSEPISVVALAGGCCILGGISLASRPISARAVQPGTLV